MSRTPLACRSNAALATCRCRRQRARLRNGDGCSATASSISIASASWRMTNGAMGHKVNAPRSAGSRFASTGWSQSQGARPGAYRSQYMRNARPPPSHATPQHTLSPRMCALPLDLSLPCEACRIRTSSRGRPPPGSDAEGPVSSLDAGGGGGEGGGAGDSRVAAGCAGVFAGGCVGGDGGSDPLGASVSSSMS